MRNGVAERLQFLIGRLQFRRAFDDAFLQFCIEPVYFIMRLFACRDVADVALNDFLITGLLHIADKLHGNAAAIPRFQRQVVIADVPVLL